MIIRVGTFLVTLFGLAMPAFAASIDGTQRLICSSIRTTECGITGDCNVGLASDINVPQFFYIDFANNRVEATRPDGSEFNTAFTTTARDNEPLILQGAENGRGWSATIDRDSGSIVIAASGSGDSDAVEFSIEMQGPVANSLEDTALLVQQAERILLEFPPTEIESTMSSIGQTADRRGAGRSDSGPHVGEITIKAADQLVRERSGAEIFQDLRERVQGRVVGAESMEFSRQAMGPSSGRAVYVQVLGENIVTLRQISDEMQSFLASLNGVFDVTDSFQEGKDEVRVEVDEARAALYGLSVDSIGRTVRTAMDGTVVATVQEGDEDIDVRVRYLPQYRRTIDDIATIRIPTTGGDLVPFGNVASLRRASGLGQIDRVDRERVIAVSADVDSNVITSVEANVLVAARFADVGEQYPGYHLEFGGEAQDTAESLQSLFRAFIVALLIMYTILGAIFKSFTQPFVVLFAIPFSLIGVVAGFFILDKPLTFMALFGVIALGGIVVNDSLLLVHFINETRARGTDRVYAIAISAKRRFRPVMLTTLSTVAGLFPLTLVDNESAAWMAPLAQAIVRGLSFSTFIVLVSLPS